MCSSVGCNARGCVLRFAEVKQIVRLLVRFALTLAAFFVLFAAASAAVRWVTFHDLGNAPPASALASLFVQGAGPALLPAIVVATLVSLFSILRVSAARPFGLLIIFLLSGFSITFGMIGVDYLERAVPQPSASAARRLEPNVLYRADNIDFYALDRRDEAVFGPLLVHEPAREPSLSIFQRAEQDRESGSLLLRGETDRQINLEAVENGYWQAFEAPVLVRRLFRDAKTVASSFGGEPGLYNIDFLLRAWSLALLLTSLWVVVRVSRWPLFNFILSLGMARAAFVVFHATQVPALRDVFRIVLSSEQMNYLVPGIFVGLSLLLMLVSVLLPPFHQWRREVSGG